MHADAELAVGDAARPTTDVELGGARERIRFLIRYRDHKFTHRFDDVFRADGIEIIRTPFRAPQANGVAERFARTARSECLESRHGAASSR